MPDAQLINSRLTKPRSPTVPCAGHHGGAVCCPGKTRLRALDLEMSEMRSNP